MYIIKCRFSKYVSLKVHMLENVHCCAMCIVHPISQYYSTLFQLTEFPADCSLLDFLIYEKILFSFLSVQQRKDYQIKKYASNCHFCTYSASN
jgi:hypothetical protein